MNGLTPQQIETARRKVLRNAVSLLRDARLLFKHRRYPRAYALAHLASEELSKLPMLVRAGLESQVTHGYNWERLGKRLRSHRSKLRSAILLEYFFDPETTGDVDLKRLIEGLNDVDATDALKNHSLYAGVREHTFVAPCEVVSSETADKMIQSSTRRLSMYLAAETATRGAVFETTPERLRSIKDLLDRLREELKR